MHIIFSSGDKKDGISIYWDDERLYVEQYQRKHKHYFCGRELLKFPIGKSVVYTILVVDYSECYCADVYSDGEIKKIFAETSFIDNKQKAGGQSAPRFARIRQQQIIQWFKKINDLIKKSVKSDKIYLGISFVYKNRFIKYLSTENKAKIDVIQKNEYSGLTGIYQYINKLEAERKSTGRG